MRGSLLFMVVASCVCKACFLLLVGVCRVFFLFAV